MGDKPDEGETSFETVGEGFFALSIATAEIADDVGIKLAREAFAGADSTVVYNDSAGKDEFEPMDVSAATNCVEVPYGTLVAKCDERSNCVELREDSVAELAEPAAEPDNSCNGTVDVTTA